MAGSFTRTSSCSRRTTAAPTPPAARRPASASTSSPRAVAAVAPGRVRAGWRSSCDARIPSQQDLRQRQHQPRVRSARLRLDAAAARVPRDRHGPLRMFSGAAVPASSPARCAARTAGSSWPGWWPADSPEPSSQDPSDVAACTTSTTSRSTRRSAKRTTAIVVFARSAAWSSG